MKSAFNVCLTFKKYRLTPISQKMFWKKPVIFQLQVSKQKIWFIFGSANISKDYELLLKKLPYDLLRGVLNHS